MSTRIRITPAELEAKWLSPDSTGMGHDHQTEEVFVRMSDGTEFACTFAEKRAALTDGTETSASEERPHYVQDTEHHSGQEQHVEDLRRSDLPHHDDTVGPVGVTEGTEG